MKLKQVRLNPFGNQGNALAAYSAIIDTETNEHLHALHHHAPYLSKQWLAP